MTDTAAEEINPLTPETFSFFDVLEGREYPRDTVQIFLDEKSAHDLNKVLASIERADPDLDIDDLVDEAKTLHDKVEASIHTFHIVGVPDDRITELREVADAHFEDKKKNVKAADGTIIRKLPEVEHLNYIRYFNALVMSCHIEQVVDSRGRVLTAPDADQVAFFLDRAPTSQKEKLQAKIGQLRVDSSGFEASVDADFLAKP